MSEELSSRIGSYLEVKASTMLQRKLMFNFGITDVAVMKSGVNWLMLQFHIDKVPCSIVVRCVVENDIGLPLSPESIRRENGKNISRITLYAHLLIGSLDMADFSEYRTEKFNSLADLAEFGNVTLLAERVVNSCYSHLVSVFAERGVGQFDSDTL